MWRWKKRSCSSLAWLGVTCKYLRTYIIAFLITTTHVGFSGNSRGARLAVWEFRGRSVDHPSGTAQSYNPGIGLGVHTNENTVNSVSFALNSDMFREMIHTCFALYLFFLPIIYVTPSHTWDTVILTLYIKVWFCIDF